MKSSNTSAPDPLALEDRRNTLMGLGRVPTQAPANDEAHDQSGVRRVPLAPDASWFVRDGGWRM